MLMGTSEGQDRIELSKPPLLRYPWYFVKGYREHSVKSGFHGARERDLPVTAWCGLFWMLLAAGLESWCSLSVPHKGNVL